LAYSASTLNTCLAYSASTLNDVIFDVTRYFVEPGQKYFRSSITRSDGFDLANKPSDATVPLNYLATETVYPTSFWLAMSHKIFCITSKYFFFAGIRHDDKRPPLLSALNVETRLPPPPPHPPFLYYMYIFSTAPAHFFLFKQKIAWNIQALSSSDPNYCVKVRICNGEFGERVEVGGANRRECGNRLHHLARLLLDRSPPYASACQTMRAGQIAIFRVSLSNEVCWTDYDLSCQFFKKPAVQIAASSVSFSNHHPDRSRPLVS